MKRIIAAQRNDDISRREDENRRLAYKAALEGIVLLKNEGVLPLKEQKIALYGVGARHTVKGGSGSGEVNERHSVTIYEGLKEKGFEILSDVWLDRYDRMFAEARKKYEEDARQHHSMTDIFGMVFTTPSAEQVREEDLADCGTAVYVLARQAGEGKDRRFEDSYRLSDAETASLKLLSQHYRNVVLIINSGSSVDLSSMDDLNIGAVVFFCQQGQEGGRALAALLKGEENFSGRLTDTWVNHYEDIPFSNEYSYLNGDTKKEYYREGIYVGYRYFDTFRVPVRYPFGYGLSYTDYEIETTDAQIEDNEVHLDVSVKNTGNRPGREVVQIYVSCPEGKLDKEYQRLVSFGKTEQLYPDEETVLNLSFKMEDLASYDEEEDRFILEKGTYLVRVGRNCRDTKLSLCLELKETVVLSRHERLLECREELGELRSSRREEEDTEGIKTLEIDPSRFETKIHRYPGLKKVSDEKVEAIMKKLSLEDKIKLVMGEVRGIFAYSTDCIYTPGSVARTTQDLLDKGIVNVNLADGPAGLRLLRESALDKDGKIKYIKGNFPVAAMELFCEIKPLEEGDEILYQYATAWPVATALAQSFDTELLEDIGKATSVEMSEYNVTFWLAPGMNIHRNPLCGRNFEYYSEDPYLSGTIASALLKGVDSIRGNYITIKHFACNNAEENRIFSDSVVSRRALREIYLKGFEIAVREGHATGLMTSYNLINGTYAPDSYDLCVKILRNEWGFDGVVMTDWTSTNEGQGDNAKAIQAGSIIMPGGPYYMEDVRKALEEGRLSEEELDIPVSQFLKAILYSDVASRIKAEDLI